MKLFFGKLLMSFATMGSAILLDTARADQIGPIGTYYLTDYSNSTTGQSSLDAIQGGNYNQNPAYTSSEGPIAVFGDLGVVRTTGFYVGGSGGEYTGVPSLTINQDGATYTSTLPRDEFYDGTTDGNFNYTVGLNSGVVIATNTSWGGSGAVLFSTGNYGDLGITYDKLNNSLWIQNFYSSRISDYSLSGTLLSFFDVARDPTIAGGPTALAMDVDHTLWYKHGEIYHYDTNGNYLGSADYLGLGHVLGGEIDASAVPEPSCFALLGLGGIGLAIGAYRRSRAVAMW